MNAHPRADAAAANERGHHVCFIGGTAYPSPLTPTQAKKFEGLTRRNRISVIGLSRDIRPRKFREHARFYLLPAIPVRPLRYALVAAAAPILGLWLVARRQVNVIVAQSPYEGCIGAWIARAASWVLGQRVALVVESHGDFERALFLQHRVRAADLYARAMRAAARTALRNADALRAVSQATATQLSKMACDRPIRVFATWSDLEPFLRAGDHREGAGHEVLYAGVVTPLKGVHHLIAAFARVADVYPHARLVVVGRAQDSAYRHQLEQVSGTLGVADRITFVPHVTQTELAMRMAQARVLVLPSSTEGLPRVVLEAMATRLPVVASNVGGIPEIVEDGVNGFLVAPGDEAQLAERLAWILDDPALARRLGQAGGEMAASRLSAESYFAEYARLIDVAATAAGVTTR